MFSLTKLYKFLLIRAFGSRHINLIHISVILENFVVVVADFFSKKSIGRKKYNFTFDNNSIIFSNSTGNVTEVYSINEDEYCFEQYLNVLHLFRKTDPRLLSSYWRFTYTRIALIISCVCILTTLISYSTIKELQNLMGKIVICYSATALTGFSILASIQFHPHMKQLCKPLGMLLYQWLYKLLGCNKTRL